MPLVVLFLLLGAAVSVQAQAPASGGVLTLADAERIALQQNPRIRAAGSQAEAADAAASGAAAELSPNLVANLTAVGARKGSRIGAGQINPSSLINRTAAGVRVTQLISDFGQTRNRIKAAHLIAESADEDVKAARSTVLLQVRRAYFDALRAQATVRVSQQTLDTRNLRLRQIRTLAENELRSTLDVSFAQLSASEAELLVATAENQIQQALAQLEAAMGADLADGLTLEPPPASPRLEQAAPAYVPEALAHRPDIAALRFRAEAGDRTAQSEHRLSRPVVTADAVMGAIPLREDGIRSTYGAAGVNVAIPLFNGKRFSSRMAEADARARAAAQELEALENEVRQQVVSAWFQADTAWRQIELNQKLVDQSAEALRLAQTRYDLGLSSIVELNQAQLAGITAEIGLVTARYDYEISRAALLFTIGSAP
ncbi:MAG: TolC family protein [Acidobacteria bacterium]|nr:TolC family protein [Acidobacteriota bacterium]